MAEYITGLNGRTIPMTEGVEIAKLLCEQAASELDKYADFVDANPHPRLGHPLISSAHRKIRQAAIALGGDVRKIKIKIERAK